MPACVQGPGPRSRCRPTAGEDFQTLEMQESRLILLQALAAAESGRSTWSRPVHCVHLLHLPAPTVHLPAVCCKPLQPPCNSPAVSALPPDVVTDAPVAAFGCGEPCSGWTAASVRRLRQRLLLPSPAPTTSSLPTNPVLSKQKLERTTNQRRISKRDHLQNCVFSPSHLSIRIAPNVFHKGRHPKNNFISSGHCPLGRSEKHQSQKC